MFEFWTDPHLNTSYDYDVLSGGSCSCLTSYCFSLWDGLFVACRSRCNTLISQVENNITSKGKIKQKGYLYNVRYLTNSCISFVIIHP